MATAFQSNAFQTNTLAFQIDVVPTPSGTTPSGVPGKAKRRDKVFRLSERTREDTAEFLKSHLRQRHPESAFDTTAQDRAAEEKARKLLAKQERREKEMRLRADREAAKFAKSSAQLEAQQKEEIAVQNDNMKILIMLGSAV